jgi:F-type H+-transporting ATPase subunit b
VTQALAFALLLALAGPAAAAEDGHGGGNFFWQVLNVLLLVGVLFYFARKPVLGYLAGRRDEIAKNLESSTELLAESERRLAEWSRKAAELDREAESIRQATRRAAEAERDRILADAHVTADRIRQSAAAVADRELRLAREALRREAADLAVELASKLLREQVNDGDRTRLLDEFIGRIEQKGAR